MDRLSRGLVVGQAPPLPPELLSSDYKPLQGQPEKRLARLAGLSLDELWTLFDRLDLLGWCPGKKDRKSYHLWSAGYRKHRCDGHRFPLPTARLVAARLRRFGGLERYAVVVLCGRLVAAAFGLNLDRSVPWTEETDGVRFLVLPHPSGVSHFWNDEESWHRAAVVFRSALRVAGLTCQAEIDGVASVQSQDGEDIAADSDTTPRGSGTACCSDGVLQHRHQGSWELRKHDEERRMVRAHASCQDYAKCKDLWQAHCFSGKSWSC